MNALSDITLEDVQKKINEKIENNIRVFESSVLSVYRQKSNSKEKPVQIGTAFVVKHKNNQYLVTAQHVFQQASSDGWPVFLSKDGKLFDLQQIKDKNFDEIFNEELDFHVIKTVDNPAGIDGISINGNINQAQCDICLTIGYPNSRNKTRIDVKNKTARLTSLRLMLSNRKSNGEIILDEENSYFFLREWSKKSLDTNWNEVDAIGVRGMSGAPCFNIPFGQKDIIFNIDPYIEVNLIGLLIEKNNEVIKFVKFSEILSHFPCT